MKKFKLTWILAGVLVLSLVYVYVIEVKWAEQKAEVKEQKERVVQFDKDKVESLLLRNPNGTFEAKRIGEDGWELVRPLKASGDKLTWNSYASS
jgi:hypothetical protein